MSYFSRLADVRAAFAGWPKLVAIGAAYKWLPLKHRELTVRTRNAGALVIPLRREAGALYALFEVFAFESWGESLDALPAAPRILDIGANVGAFTRLAAARFPDATGISFEPDPETFAYLRRNVQGLSFEAQEVAVAGESGRAVLFRTGAGDGISSLIEEAATTNLVDTTTVAKRAIADILEAEDRNVDLMKVDCEGAEYEILDSGDALLWQPVQRLALEYHPVAGRSIDGLIERIEELGFDVDDHVPLAPGLGMLWASRHK